MESSLSVTLDVLGVSRQIEIPTEATFEWLCAFIERESAIRRDVQTISLLVRINQI